VATLPSGLIDRGQEEVEHDGWIAADAVIDLVVATCQRTSSSTTRPSRRSQVEGRATSRAGGRERDDGDPLHAQTRDSWLRGGTPGHQRVGIATTIELELLSRVSLDKTHCRLYLEPTLGDLRVGAITGGDVADVLRTIRGRKLSESTAKHALTVLGAIYRLARARKVVTRSPLDARPRRKTAGAVEQERAPSH
jgi:hypothetical protein